MVEQGLGGEREGGLVKRQLEPTMVCVFGNILVEAKLEGVEGIFFIFILFLLCVYLGFIILNLDL